MTVLSKRSNKAFGIQKYFYKILQLSIFFKNKPNIKVIPLEAKGFIFRINRSFFYLSRTNAQLHCVTMPETEDPSTGLFKKYLTNNRIFKDREVLRHSYRPQILPHRKPQIDEVASILAPSLRNETPSNILIYGKTGTGKTACVRYVGTELEKASSKMGTLCRIVHLNCEVIDTQYRVLAQIAKCLDVVDEMASDKTKTHIPMTGLANRPGICRAEKPA